MTGIRVVVADDHPIFREGLRMLLASVEDVEVVAEAETTDELVRVVTGARPDVVVLDVDMPERGGVEVIPDVLALAPGCAVLMLTMLEDPGTLAAAIRAGARGYLLKGSGQVEVVAALRSVAAGGSAFGPGVSTQVLETFLLGDEARPPVLPELTGREREVVALVADGATNPDIARRLFLSPKTVRNLVSSAMAKLAVRDRTALSVAGRAAGLGGRPR